jgi:hypothetical protein
MFLKTGQATKLSATERIFGEGAQGEEGKKSFEMTSLLVKNILEVTEEIIYDIILICTE